MENINEPVFEEVETSKSMIHKLLEDARRRLVETGTRNRLIHVNRANKRANVLNVINERSDDIYEILRSKGRKMKFLAQGEDDEPEDGDTPLLDHIVSDEVFDEKRYTDSNLETPLGIDAQQKRLLKLYRDAKTAEEEQGINILYLAMGFLTWYEDKTSAVKREAPIILLPVELVRNARTSTYDIICRDDDLVTNLPLQERLKNDFGIELPEIDNTDDFLPSAYFAEIASLIENKKNWAIDSDGMQLGFFSFAKLLMLRDLDPENWPSGLLTENPIINGLLGATYEAGDLFFGSDDKLDEKLEPATIIQVVDADASQTMVIEEVRRGSDLVVQGPPGTGKSQTITNIIAAAVHDGKRVLFVAEKMAALKVVHDRLVKTNLRNICLELHSRNANKKSVIAELSRTLNEASAIPNMPDAPDKLKHRRDMLNGISNLLHKQIPETDSTPYDALSKLIHFLGSDTPAPVLQSDDLAKLSEDDCKSIDNHIGSFAKIVGDIGKTTLHPFYGAENLSLTPTDIERLNKESESALSELKSLLIKANETAELLKIDTPKTYDEILKLRELLEVISKMPVGAENYITLLFSQSNRLRLREALSTACGWKEKRDQLETTFSEIAFETNISHMRVFIQKGIGSFFGRLGGKYRTTSKELETLLKKPMPKAANERLVLIDDLLDLQRKRKALSEEEGFLSKALEDEWRGERTSFSKVEQANNWVEKVMATGFQPDPKFVIAANKDSKTLNNLARHFVEKSETSKTICATTYNRIQLSYPAVFGTDNLEDAQLSDVQSQLEAVNNHSDRYDEWRRLSRAMLALDEGGLKTVIEQINLGELDASGASTEFHYARAEALWGHAKTAFPKLDRLSEIPRHQLVSEFQGFEKQRIEDVKQIIYTKHLEQLPRGASGEMAIIRGEIGKKRSHKPIRKLIQQTGEAIQRIKPVMLMSPISVAQFLPPGTIEFDLLVIDEASQVRPEDALGAIARARQIVVVGDQQQLPPTNFFSKLTGNDDEDDEDEDDPLAGAAKATELESILSLCEARGLHRRMLEWHYRSRDPSLIQVSNAEFYDHGLVLPPSPLQEDDDYGFKFTKVDGVYSSAKKGGGRPSTNKIEAQSVVDALANHAREWPDMSVGVVTFSVRQRDMITELLEHARRNDNVLDQFLREGKNEDVFVKNIENVQGDERDVILISVGYGPHEARGRLPSMSFGPINRDGGERRLNVLFSRSRIRCEVFASFEPGDIDLNRTTKEGPRVLKRFLEFAKSGVMDEKISTGMDADSPFEEDVASEIERLGYQVDKQVGSGGFYIDLGVKHPKSKGQYMLAVECDGATYHSALWARERDRLRQAVLEGLGWNFHRIWSTDWFHRRREEIERLDSVLKKAQQKSDVGDSISGANEGFDPSVYEIESDKKQDKIEIAPLEIQPISVPFYALSNVSVNSRMEPHEVGAYRLADTVKKIVSVEGPIHEEEVARRLARAFGKNKAGRRIVETAKDALGVALRSNDSNLVFEGQFWMLEEQKNDVPVRNRSQETGSVLKAQFIAPIEFKAAAKLIVEQSGHVEDEELIKAVGSLLGFKRVGPDLREGIANALSIE